MNNPLSRRSVPGVTELDLWVVSAGAGAAVIGLGGTLDATTADDLESRLAGELIAPRKVLLDLGRVDYLSSMGLSVILKTAIKLKSSGFECRIYDPQRSVRRVLEIAKWGHLILDPAQIPLDDPFLMYVNAEEPVRAVRRVSGPAAAAPPRLYPD